MAIVSVILAIGVMLTSWGMFSARSKLATMKADKERIESSYNSATVSAEFAVSQSCTVSHAQHSWMHTVMTNRQR